MTKFQITRDDQDVRVLTEPADDRVIVSTVLTDGPWQPGDSYPIFLSPAEAMLMAEALSIAVHNLRHR